MKTLTAHVTTDAARELRYNGASSLYARPYGTTHTVPALVIPLTPESVQQMRDKMAAAFNGSYDGHLHKDDLTAMLRAIGVPKPNL